MHILQLVPTLEVGGVERGVLDLAKGLIARGHSVSVVSAGGALVDELHRLGAMHHTMPVDQKSPWSAWRTIPTLCQLVRDTKVDLIHARSRVPAWIGYAAARRTGVPFVTTAHGFYTPHPVSRVMGWGRVVIVPSKALGRYLIDRFHVPPERLRVIPRGVDLAQFPFRPAPPGGPAWQGELSTRTSVQRGGEEVRGVSTGIFPETTPPTAGWGGVRGHPPHEGRAWRFGVIGRLTALKGHEVAIRALHQLASQHLPVSLCVIGDTPPNKPQLRSQLLALAQILGVEPAIEWLGTRRDIPECLASLDGVLVPSTYPESFGRSVVEAQAVGV
ncbi:MAG: glycosyltransferase, partial [Candidatus Omnitrophica bacterium]|nr:glycosyltransferase [Candidatus Omnitrophota bacterium]